MARKETIHVLFEQPQHGGIAFSLEYAGQRVSDVISYIPQDFIAELIPALSYILQYRGSRIVTLHILPAEIDLRFTRLSDEEARLEVVEYGDLRRVMGTGKNVMDLTLPVMDLCLPFWRAISRLWGGLDGDAYISHWHHTFPERELADLTRLITALKGKPLGN